MIPVSSVCPPTLLPPVALFTKLRLGTLEHSGGLCPPAGLRVHQVLTVCGALTSCCCCWCLASDSENIKKNTDLIIFQHTGCFLWPSTLCEEGRQVFGSYQLWNQAPLPPFVCLPPGLNSIDQRLAGLLLQPGSEAAKKPWLASTTNRQYLFLITQLYFSPQPRVPKRCTACTEHARECSVFVSH